MIAAVRVDDDAERQQAITEAQLRIPKVRGAETFTREAYRWAARWWELEAERGYPSAEASRRYAANMRWAAELAGLHGPGTWLDLLERAGVRNPVVGRVDGGESR